MSTRGTYGFKINKELKMIMSHYDSYPGGLGDDIIKFLRTVDLARLTDKVQQLQAIPKSLINKNELAEKKIWRDPEQVLQAIYMGTLQSFFDAQEFLNDPLFCEFSYIINLDTKMLEVYEAGNLLTLGRFPLRKIPKNFITLMNQQIKKFEQTKCELLGMPYIPDEE
jgi:hypothetical protein